MLDMSEWHDCKHIFSNGTEFELFMERCWKCARFRNDHCAILNRCYRAMWDKEEFPYEHLLEHDKYGGKLCKKFTTEKPERHRRIDPNQLAMVIPERR